MFSQKLDITHDRRTEQKVLLSAKSKPKLYKVSIKIWTQNCVICIHKHVSLENIA